MSSDARDCPGVVAPPPLIYAAGLGVGMLCERLLPSAALPTLVTGALGAALIFLGMALMGLGLWTLRCVGTPVNPYAATTALAMDGPYRYSRNPLYVALTLLYLGISLTAGGLWSLALLPAVLFIIQRGVIAREERYLEAKFGHIYLEYKARVRRWL